MKKEEDANSMKEEDDRGKYNKNEEIKKMLNPW
jgi:hypothetical protein